MRARPLLEEAHPEVEPVLGHADLDEGDAVPVQELALGAQAEAVEVAGRGGEGEGGEGCGGG